MAGGSIQSDELRAVPEQGFTIPIEAEGGDEIVGAIVGQRLADGGGEIPRFVLPAGQRQAMRGDGQDDDMGIGSGRCLQRPLGGFIELPSRAWAMARAP